MRKSLTMFAALACAWAWAQQAALYVGSDWDRASGPLLRAWEEPAFAGQAGAAAEAEPPPPLPEPPAPRPEPKPPLPAPPPPLPAPRPEPKPRQEAKPEPEPRQEPKPRQEAKTKTKKAPEEPKWKATLAKDTKKGKCVGPVTSGRKDRTKAPTAKALSAAEIQRLLNAGARPGNRNQVPPNEASRCYVIIQRVFREACTGLEASPNGEAPILKVTFGAGGTVRGITVAKSSGDRAFDAQVLAACRRVKRVDGLTDGFLRKWDYVVEIRVDVLMPR